jgi:hypothetical protein
MAWIFSLSAECGPEQRVAAQFARHFDDASWILSNDSQCRTEIFQDIEENWWCRVCPINMGGIGTDTPETAYRMTELGLSFYQRLRTAPSFRYALVGVEVDEFRTYRELIEKSPVIAFPGLVLAEAVWQTLGSPSAFRPFSPGYVWKPYEGETYKPLMASSTLKDKLNELLILQ